MCTNEPSREKIIRLSEEESGDLLREAGEPFQPISFRPKVFTWGSRAICEEFLKPRALEYSRKTAHMPHTR
jgi:hypothetical protein